MKTDNETQEESLKIPMDMLMDVLTVIIREAIPHEIIQVQPNRNQIIMAVTFVKNESRSQKAVNNIQNMLTDYQHYRHWENEELNWRND